MTETQLASDVCVRLLCPRRGTHLKALLQNQGVSDVLLCSEVGQLAHAPPTVGMRLLLIEHNEAFDIAGVLEFIARLRRADAVIVLGDNLPIHAVKALSKLTVWDTVSSQADESEILDVCAQILDAAAAHHLAVVSEPVEKPARCWSFVSTVGGAGASLLAAETAYQLSKSRKTERVCLIDLNFTDGSIASYLNSEANLSVRALQQSAEAVDATFLNSVTSQCHDRLHVIAAPRWTSSDVQPDDEMILRMLDVACETFDTVLIDIPRWPMPWTDKVFAGCDLVLMISELTVPALNASRFWMQRMDTVSQFDSSIIRPVLNRQHKGMFGARVSMSQAEESLMRPVFSLVRSDWPSALAAVNLGKPVSEVKPNSPIPKDISAMIERLLSTQSAQSTHAA